MKKALVLTLIMVLAMAGVASAEVSFGGEFKVEYVVDTDKETAEDGAAEAPLKLKAVAEEEGVWKADAELKADANKPGELKVGKWSMNLNDDLFTADLWGNGVEKSEVKTPLEFFKAGKTGTDDKARMRLTSDVAGYVDLTLDYDYAANDLFVFAEKALDEVTVGGNIKKNLTEEGVLGTAHVKYVYGPATLTGEVGMDTAEEEDNFLGGGKVDYKLNDQITLKGKATYKAENVGDELLLEAGADYVENLFKVGGTLTRTDDLDNDDTEATYKVKGNVTYRSNEDVAYDDLFDDYDKLTGYAAFAELAYTTAQDYDYAGDDKELEKRDLEPIMEATIKGAGVAVPDMVWVYGEFSYKSDEDENVKDEDFQFILGNNKLTDEAVLWVKDYFKVSAEATVQITDKLQAVPTVKYGTWNTLAQTKTEVDKDDDGTLIDSYYNGLTAKDMSELELGAGLTYELSDSSEVGLSYTNRTQKFTEPKGITDMGKELKDSFVKVYFKTSF